MIQDMGIGCLLLMNSGIACHKYDMARAECGSKELQSSGCRTYMPNKGYGLAISET